MTDEVLVRMKRDSQECQGFSNFSGFKLISILRTKIVISNATSELT